MVSRVVFSSSNEHILVSDKERDEEFSGFGGDEIANQIADQMAKQTN